MRRICKYEHYYSIFNVLNASISSPINSQNLKAKSFISCLSCLSFTIYEIRELCETH